MSELQPEKKTIGWREWIRLPNIGVKLIKAKIDTGARTSSIHAFDVEIVKRGDEQWVRFKIHPMQNNLVHIVEAEAKVAEFRNVRSSNGQTTTRPVIRTLVDLYGTKFEIDVTLFDREQMGFRMLIGREALRTRFVVDSARSYCGGKPKRKKKRTD